MCACGACRRARATRPRAGLEPAGRHDPRSGGRRNRPLPGGRLICGVRGNRALRAQSPALVGCHDVSGAGRRTAAARVFPPVLEPETVVERDLLAPADVPIGDDPDAPAVFLGAAAGFAGVIDVPADVAPAPGIQVVTTVQPERISARVFPGAEARQACGFTSSALSFRDPLAPILHDDIAGRNIHARIDSLPVNT